MKKILFFIYFLLYFLSSVFSQTYVSGFILADTTWTIPGSPYIIIGNTLVNQNVVLTIEPGVIIKFDSLKSLQIDGELNAVGTMQNRIVFTSSKPIPNKGDWGKIQFSDLSNDAVYDVAGNYISGSIMNYCDVLYGGGLGLGELHLETSYPLLMNCRILNSANAGIYGENGMARVLNSVISHCDGKGINAFDFMNMPYPLIISGDSILYNNGMLHIYTVQSYNFEIIINNNFFYKNYGFGANFDVTLATSNPHQYCRIKENIFKLNNDSGSASSGFLIDADKYVVNCNKFYSNKFNGSLLEITNHMDTISTFIGNSFIENYTTFSNCKLIYFHDTYNSWANSMLMANNNYFLNNQIPNGSLIQIISNHFGNYFFKYMIENNTFAINPCSNIFTLSQSNTFPNNINPINIHRNNFLDSTVQYFIYNNIPFGSFSIYADSNYYATTNTSYIDSKIYDFFDAANLSVVYYSPLSSSAFTTDTICSSLTNINEINKIKNSEIFIFPNPTTDYITIHYNVTSNNKTTVMLFNLYGQIVYSENPEGLNEIKIDMRSFAAGVYFVKMNVGGKEEVRKVVKYE